MSAPEYLDPVRDELHQLRAKIARIERLIASNVEEWEGLDVVVVADLRAALADKEPTP